MATVMRLKNENGNSSVVGWGKYEGRTVQWILDNDPDYLKWCYYNLKNANLKPDVLEALNLPNVPFKERERQLKRVVMSKEQHLKMTGKLCPYCGAAPKLVDSAVIYNGVSYGMIWLCSPCDAYVGVHKGGKNKPLGRLANAALREWKKKAHAAFDPIWKSNLKSRKEAYSWLSQALKIPRIYTHIGMFGVDTCKKVVEICLKELE
jgi:hypothetical protein